MKHLTSSRFWAAYRRLPASLRETADDCFSLMESNPRHPSLHFKKKGRFWSARIGLAYRALAIRVPEGFLWIWIGDHDTYQRMLGKKT